MRTIFISFFLAVFLFCLSGTTFAGFNCITQDRGVHIAWFGDGGYLKITKVRKMSSDFRLTVDMNKKGKNIFSGVPSNGQKISIPKGTKDVILNISDGEGEVCYSRSTK
ncbi:MAG: hypothetical protein ACQEQS_11055 [Thermodesulfobacteriota bacterium]